MGIFKDTIIYGSLNVTGTFSARRTKGFDAKTLDTLDSSAFINKELTNDLTFHTYSNVNLKNWKDSYYNLGSISGNISLLDSYGNFMRGTATGNTTFTFPTLGATGYSKCFTLILLTAGLYTITWPSSVKWENAEIPVLSTVGYDILTFLTVNDGTTWYGIPGGYELF